MVTLSEYMKSRMVLLSLLLNGHLRKYGQVLLWLLLSCSTRNTGDCAVC